MSTTTTNPTSKPIMSTTTTNLPPPFIPPQLSHLPNLPSQLTSPTSPLFPTTWRCGTCATLHPVLSLMTSPTAHCACAAPALQAVYDQFGDIYLFWRDDPAVADLSVPGMAEEARWRVWRAGGDGWGAVKGLDWESMTLGNVVDMGRVGGAKGLGMGRNSRALSQSSAASDESEDSMGVGRAMEA